MEKIISKTKNELGEKAAITGAGLIRSAIQKNGTANIIVATGASQFEMLNDFIKQDFDWSIVTGFHLDEYISMIDKHPASFRKYLKERFVDKIPLKEFHYVAGETEAQAECDRLEEIKSNHPIDVAFVGIGENGHLAFGDPVADFETDEAYLVVNLDEACRKQQMGEGWFKTMEDVPKQAISMSIKQIMKSKAIICSVLDKRKAKAAQGSLEEEVSPLVPASMLQQHNTTWIYLDKGSASFLD